MSGEPLVHPPVRVQLHTTMPPATRAAVIEFVADAAALGGGRLDDLLTGDLAFGPNPGFVAATAVDAHDRLVAYAQASAANEGSSIGFVAPPTAGIDASALAQAVLHPLLAALAPGSSTTWWATDTDVDVAASLGLVPHRRLLEMRVPLPVAATTDVDVRGFRVGDDDDAWLEVNNAAFAWHGEQGGWTLAMLQQRQREPWFAAEGFLVHERAGRMAAFCWTKLHREPALLGEIYVIAVHPDFHGLGLGRALTVAGLQHLHDADGATAATLFVDADNTAAVTLYDHLGFTVANARQAYWRPSTPPAAPTGLDSEGSTA